MIEFSGLPRDTRRVVVHHLCKEHNEALHTTIDAAGALGREIVHLHSLRGNLLTQQHSANVRSNAESYLQTIKDARSSSQALLDYLGDTTPEDQAYLASKLKYQVAVAGNQRRLIYPGPILDLGPEPKLTHDMPLARSVTVAKEISSKIHANNAKDEKQLYSRYDNRLQHALRAALSDVPNAVTPSELDDRLKNQRRWHEHIFEQRANAIVGNRQAFAEDAFKVADEPVQQ